MCMYIEEIVRIINIAQQIFVHRMKVTESSIVLEPINLHCVDNTSSNCVTCASQSQESLLFSVGYSGGQTHCLMDILSLIRLTFLFLHWRQEQYVVAAKIGFSTDNNWPHPCRFWETEITSVSGSFKIFLCWLPD